MVGLSGVSFLERGKQGDGLVVFAQSHDCWACWASRKSCSGLGCCAHTATTQKRAIIAANGRIFRSITRFEMDR